MLTKTLALTQRGLRRDTRVLTSHLLRLGVLLIVCLAVFGAHLASVSVGAPGLGFFSWIAYTTLVFATVAGATFFATAITEEKEEQTLGLLTLADIRPAALIAGKFLPRLLNAVAILTVALPFTLLSITLGGVTWDQVWAAYWTLLAHVVFMGSIGLFFSVVCRTSGMAIGWSIAAMLAYFVTPPILWSARPTVIPASASPMLPHVLAAIETLYEASAFVRIGEILETGFAEGAFRVQVVMNLAASGALLLVSWALFALFNRGVEAALEKPPVLGRALRFQRGSRRSWKWALVWKDFHSIAGGWEGVLARLFAYSVVAVVVAVATNDLRFNDELRRAVGYALTTTMIAPVLPIELTVLAARLFRSEIRERTWPTLAGLPQSVASLAAGKLMGGLLGLAPAAGLALLGVVIAPDGFVEALMSGPDVVQIASMFILYFAIFLVFLHLTALYSILYNAWAGVLLAAVTLWIGSCFTGPLFLLPFMLVNAGTGDPLGWLGLVLGAVIYVAPFVGICFGLEVLIVQQLRTAAER
jgi:ABC-type transport system involved in multi-copper enzyme maturation permease subunit